MLKKILIVCALLSPYAFADTEPGGWVEPGGYDPIAEERQKNARLEKESEERKKAFNESQKKAELKRKSDAAMLAKKQKNYEKDMLKPENMAKVDDQDACIKAGKEIRSGKPDNWQNEIRRRSLSLSRDNVRARSFNIGSTVCEVYASLGMPSKVNRTVRKNYVRKQIVYSGVYIYTENDVVTSWQD